MDPEKQLMDQPIEEESDMDEDEKKLKGDWHQQLLSACQKGDLTAVQRCLDKRANVLYEDKKKWNPLMWASCRGYTEIVRVLLSRQAAAPYVPEMALILQNFAQTMPIYSSPQNASSPTKSTYFGGSPGGGAQSAVFNFQQQQLSKKVVQGIINQQVRSTPLMWACFKGHVQVVWLLLKAGLSWEDVDQFGNNSVHLAASGGNQVVFQTLLFYGVAVDRPNTRGHTAKDLATNAYILQLIKLLEISGQTAKYFCMTCRKFWKQEEYRMDWVYENAESNDTEKPEGRCLNCWNTIKKHTEELLSIIDKQDHKLLTEKLNEIEKGIVIKNENGKEEFQRIEIDPKNYKFALIEQEKLRTQNVILEYLSTLKHVANYKTILKSVNQIQAMLDDAVNRGVKIDAHVKEEAEKEMERLKAERNLQFELDNLDIGLSTPEQVVVLNDKVVIATEKGVDKQYIDQASELRDKMAKAIQAKKILKMFNEYPAREIPDPIKWDPKTKKPIDPITGKPIDPLKLALQNQKKKKKKEPKFVIPEWANDVKSLDENIKGLEGLLKEAEVLNLNHEFVEESVQQIKRMKNEMRYRKEVDEQLKWIADAKAAEKKKNK
ncbi:unnamed protein product [Paramecium pentaurelia]|uniref:Ankyrin repeat protein n=1 Tax=Paramecium pentaurelia TaxID=43138 RepID=A0A8S1YB48_9CILI|nr:unnamed protein product [Paramecium pentaurelia]